MLGLLPTSFKVLLVEGDVRLYLSIGGNPHAQLSLPYGQAAMPTSRRDLQIFSAQEVDNCCGDIGSYSTSEGSAGRGQPREGTQETDFRNNGEELRWKK